jgi:hypothetical protein
MSKLGLAMFQSASVAALLASSFCVGCVSNDPEDEPGSAGSGNAATAGSGGSTSGGTASGGGGSGGSASGTGGSSGSATTTAACATEATASGTSPTISDFESMTSPTGTYTFESGGLLGGTYIYTDGMAPATDPSTSKLAFGAGHDAASTQALVGTIHNATWGGGMGLWFACVDASAYTGVTFWAKGSSPAGEIAFNLTVNDVEVESKGGLCPDAGPCERPSAKIEITEEWKQYTFKWADFTPGNAAGTPVPGSGDNLYGIDFTLPNDDMSRDLELAIDDVAFTE